jgi:hypothetical protein
MARPLRKSYYYQPLPLKSREECTRQYIEMSRNRTERQIDQMLEDSFPCSDPPAW